MLRVEYRRRRLVHPRTAPTSFPYIACEKPIVIAACRLQSLFSASWAVLRVPESAARHFGGRRIVALQPSAVLTFGCRRSSS